jgi:hypothetical protein
MDSDQINSHSSRQAENPKTIFIKKLCLAGLKLKECPNSLLQFI